MSTVDECLEKMKKAQSQKRKNFWYAKAVEASKPKQAAPRKEDQNE